MSGVGGPVGVVGTVGRILRFPVKSMAGETLSEAWFGPGGLEGDRAWAVYTPDGKLGSGKNSRRFRAVDGLRQLRAQLADGSVRITAPDGQSWTLDDAASDALLSAALGRELAVRAEGEERHHDDSDVHLVTASSVATLEQATGGLVDPARFRPNLVVDTDPALGGFTESGWVGRRVAVGRDLILSLDDPMGRCLMVDADGLDLVAGPRVLTTLGRLNNTELGVQASVARPGRVVVGDPVVLLDR